MRLFFALWPPRDAAEALARWAKAFEGRAIPAEKIHLTLAFLGGVDAGKAIAAARRVRAGPFELPLESAKYVRGNEMVWVAPLETPPGLKALVERLHFELYRAEFILERRPFAAHVTLLRKAPRPKAMAALPEVGWPVREFALVNSVNGAYQDVERFSLDRE
ncbi:MAG TPA: RNA 2',3'-cyclic phosphodiesterase [Burkholderiales bacterium]|nr:RNA 2',3'-cyclic phosphodiesterase [Burkholderiales bacterium]